ncbi:LOT5-like protein [Elsinoe fawcettii]|nr:LOT5-like protein [Elsinoe fawcettii]
MALEALSIAPSKEDFQALEEYQASTPATFFGGKPVLHYHNPSCTLTVSTSALASTALSNLAATTPDAKVNGDSHTNGTSNTNGESNDPDTTLKVEAWVTSAHFTLFSPSAGKGLQIPYPVISLHAQQGQGLYMQLILNASAHTSDDELETLELVLTPDAQSSTSSDDNASASDGISGQTKSEAEALYAAVSDCADLHPDPDPDDEGEENAASLMAMLQGAAGGDIDLSGGGWITADNMHEHMDADGNITFPGGEAGEIEGLGPGAGTRRGPEDDADQDGVTDVDETKWRRTD